MKKQKQTIFENNSQNASFKTTDWAHLKEIRSEGPDYRCLNRKQTVLKDLVKLPSKLRFSVVARL